MKMGNTSNGTVHQIVDNCHLNFDNCTSHSAQELFQTFDCNDITWASNWKLGLMFSRAFWENEKNKGGNIIQCPKHKQTCFNCQLYCNSMVNVSYVQYVRNCLKFLIRTEYIWVTVYHPTLFYILTEIKFFGGNAIFRWRSSNSSDLRPPSSSFGIEWHISW